MQKSDAGRAADQLTGQVSCAWFAYMLVGLVTTGVYFLLPSESLQSIVWNTLGLSAVVALIFGVHAYQPLRTLPWYVLALGLLLLISGDVIWNYYENVLSIELSVPSVADVLYLAALPCMALGLVLMLRVGTSGPQWGSLIDILIVTTIAGVLSWIFLIEPNTTDQTRSLVEHLVAVTYPLMDLVLFVAVLRLLLTAKKGLVAHYLLIFSVLFLLIGDTGYGWLQLTDTYETGNPIDGGYLLFYTLLGSTGLHPSMANLTAPEPHIEPRLTWQRLALLTATLLMAPVMLAYQAMLGYPINVPLIVGGSGVLFLLVAVRMAGMIGERKVLEQRLKFQALHDPLTHLPNQAEEPTVQRRREGQTYQLDELTTLRRSASHHPGPGAGDRVGASLAVTRLCPARGTVSRYAASRKLVWK